MQNHLFIATLYRFKYWTFRWTTTCIYVVCCHQRLVEFPFPTSARFLLVDPELSTLHVGISQQKEHSFWVNYIVFNEKLITQCRLSQYVTFLCKIIWRFQVRLLSFIQKINISFLNQSTSYDIKYKEETYFFGSSETDIQELMGATLSVTVIKAESWFFYKFVAEHDFLLQYRASNRFKKNTIWKVWKAHELDHKTYWHIH